ncbi:MAG TPA: tetratricopeptide repeat protein [Acidobacteriota bacterium]|nr:tetratricopeptide repeat protein [Acidobacteriota bacterium]
MQRWQSLFLVALAALLAACNSDSEQLLERAEARWREGNYEDALRLNALLYQHDPQGKHAAQALLRNADIYYLNLRQVKDAIEAYKRVVSEFPGRRQELLARQQLAAIYENEIGDLTQAISEYDHLLEAKELDNRPEMQFRRAGAYFKMQHYDAAWRELRRMEEAGVSGHLADQICLKLGSIDQIKRQYSEAVSYFARVAEAPCPECRRRAILNLAETYEALYDFDKAIDALGRLDRADKQLADAEVARLREMRRKVNSQATLSWEDPKKK